MRALPDAAGFCPVAATAQLGARLGAPQARRDFRAAVALPSLQWRAAWSNAKDRAEREPLRMPSQGRKKTG